MKEKPSVDAVAKALGNVGRVMGGIEVGHLVADPALLVLLGGPDMNQPSTGRRRLAQRVSTALSSYIQELQPLEDRLTAQVMLATEHHPRDKNIAERVEVIYDGGKGRLTQDSFNKRRPGVVRRLAEHLVADFADFDPTTAPAEGTQDPFDAETSEILSALIWHAQELACYMLAFRLAVVSASRASVDDPKEFALWGERLSEPKNPARYSFYEYLRIGELIWDLQRRSSGRRFLREYGLEHLEHPALGFEHFVPVSFTPWANGGDDIIAAGVVSAGQLLVSVSGPFGTRADYLARLKTDSDLSRDLAEWNHAMTSHIADKDSLLEFAKGRALAPLEVMGIRDLLLALAEVGLSHFASVQAMQSRTRVLDLFIVSNGVDWTAGPLSVTQATDDDLEAFSQRALWSAMTMHRFLESTEWDGSDDLPEQPGRKTESPGSEA
ncbi:MAG TPA: hypothetical protein VHZ98_16015 [Galbitalea sp.]|nr:hypothetical protein [Galbitalea sp.]